jgi:hypothetical protein
LHLTIFIYITAFLASISLEAFLVFTISIEILRSAPFAGWQKRTFFIAEAT